MTAPAEEPSLDQLAREFTDDMYDGYRYLARTINYRARRFLEMVTMRGGVGAAQILLSGADASDGFTTLWEAGELGHSVEAYVLHAKYIPLFSEEERERAWQRLDAHGFPVRKYLRNLPEGRRWD